MRISNGLYDILRWIADLVLPSLGTLYFALSQIWNFPYGEEIVGTITAIVAFLDVVLGFSKKAYNTDRVDGIIFEDEDTEVDDDEI